MTEKTKVLSEMIEQSENIVFLGGAGVSTESGIPDFRSEKGIYATVQKYGFPPERLLSRTYFYDHTEYFYDFYRHQMIHTEALPNMAHKALAKLEAMGKLKAIITQNIDGLHQMAGSSRVLELHGSIYRNRCISCGLEYGLNSIIEKEEIPKCDRCHGIIKPEVTLYEEGLDEEILSQSVQAVSNADLLIIGGTSLNVYPAAGLISYFKGKALVLINRGETPYDDQADLLIRESIGQVLDEVVN